MIIKRNKKGGVELSLNLIILLIIGMVVLGLVIGFVNSLVSKGAANFDKQLGANEKLKIDKVKSCPDNLCLDPYPSATMKLGGKTNIYIKVRPTTFNMGSNCDAGSLGDNCELTYNITNSTGIAKKSVFSLVGPGFSAKKGNSEAHRYILTGKGTSGSASIDTYFLTFKLNGLDSKTITLTIE